MSVQRFSPKKVAKIARLTGLDLDMVWNASGAGPVYGARDRSDRHYLVNVKTGAWELQEDPCHMTSCRERGE